MEPIVADRQGNLFSKEGFLEQWILHKKTVKSLFPHIHNPHKDLITVHFHPNSAYTKKEIIKPERGEPGPWVCPLKENIEVNGQHRFSVLEPCGHVFSDASVCNDILSNVSINDYHQRRFTLKEKEKGKQETEILCPLCSTAISNIIPLAPPKEETVLLISNKDKEKHKNKEKNNENQPKIEEKEKENETEKEKEKENTNETNPSFSVSSKHLCHVAEKS